MSTPDAFAEAFRSKARVQGLTHDFYKYPARFHPGFVRFVIDELTQVGDWVLDPFMGGGTTVVESVSSGRRVVGSDVNQLARFVTTVKTTPLSRSDISQVRDWVGEVQKLAGVIKPHAIPFPNDVKNMPPEVQPFFRDAIGLVGNLRFPRRRSFARCALLRLGQWALDGKRTVPSISDLRTRLDEHVNHMVSGLDELVEVARDAGTYKYKLTSLKELRSYPASDGRLAYNLRTRGIKPKLVLTSPPYPGVHILYHRWQVLGRRETPAPYWITDLRDGHGEAHYTMGGRSELGLNRYYARLLESFQNLRRLIAPDAYIVQLISFSDTHTQLPRYLETMKAAGLSEESTDHLQSREVRTVPNRKWYNQLRDRNDASNEVLLVHRASN